MEENLKSQKSQNFPNFQEKLLLPDFHDEIPTR